MPEWSIGAVSKTVIPSGIQGSNPCLSAKEQKKIRSPTGLLYFYIHFEEVTETQNLHQTLY